MSAASKHSGALAAPAQPAAGMLWAVFADGKRLPAYEAAADFEMNKRHRVALARELKRRAQRGDRKPVTFLPGAAVAAVEPAAGAKTA